MTTMLDSLLAEDSADSEDGLPPPPASRPAEHIIAAPSPSSDEWITLRHKGVARLPAGSIVRGLAAGLEQRHLRALIASGDICRRDEYAGTFSGIVHRHGDPPPPVGPRYSEIPRLRADERFDNGLAQNAKWAEELRAQEKTLAAEIETAIEEFDHSARKTKDRRWREVSHRALAVLELEKKLEAHRARLQELLRNAGDIVFGCFDTIVASSIGVPIEELGLERRPTSVEHRDGKMILSLFNGQKVEVPCA
jgi:hypothetical protein